MKTNLPGKAKKLASTLIATLVICAILSVFVAYYVTLLNQQSLLSSRSQTWNMAMALVEAGIEEGLEALNTQTNSANLSSDGWSANGAMYTRTRTLSDGNTYTVKLDLSNPYAPQIYATATVNAPTTMARSSGSIFFAAQGVTATAPTVVSRAVHVTCAKSTIWPAAAFVAKNNIDLKGNGVYTDSYDSSDPAKSTNGRYDSTKYSGDLGDIATDGGITSSVGIQNANIYGRVHTGPNCPVTIGSQGGIGPHGGQVGDISTASAKGYLLQDANFTFPDTTMINWSSLLPVTSNTVIVASYSYGTNSSTSTTYPSPPPSGGVATNQGSSTTSYYPTNSPAWVTTNSTSVTSSSLPSPVPAGTITNYTTASTTTGTYPSPGSYIGGVTTNNIAKKGKPPQYMYTYNLITSKSYTYKAVNYTWPCYTYTYNLAYTNTTYTTNAYPYYIGDNQTNVLRSSSYLGGPIFVQGSNACLVMPDGMTGAENIQLDNGARLLIYAGGSSVAISGNNVVNPSGLAANFVVYCAPSVTSFTLNGNGEFTGILVAPNADVNMHGGGSSNEDFCGTLMANNIGLNGHFSFHYDESVNKTPKNGRYLVKSWDEIDPATVPN